MLLVEGMYLVEVCTEVHLINTISRAYCMCVLRFIGVKAAPTRPEAVYLPVSLGT